MAYKAIDEKKGSRQNVQKGIKKFPGSGECTMNMVRCSGRKKYRAFASGKEELKWIQLFFNYYNASRYYYYSYDKVWSLIYGRDFLSTRKL